MFKKTTFLYISLLLLSAFKIHDGDTISQISYRMAYIDAPELKQTCKRNGNTLFIGEMSRDHLAALSKNHIGECKLLSNDRYGRFVALCPFNLQMVRDGMAVCYDEYMNSDERKKCHEQQHYAETNKLGIWQCDNFMTPKEWRKSKRNN